MRLNAIRISKNSDKSKVLSEPCLGYQQTMLASTLVHVYIDMMQHTGLVSTFPQPAEYTGWEEKVDSYKNSELDLILKNVMWSPQYIPDM